MRYEVRSFASDPAPMLHALMNVETHEMRREVRKFFGSFGFKCKFSRDIIYVSRRTEKRSYHLRQVND